MKREKYICQKLNKQSYLSTWSTIQRFTRSDHLAGAAFLAAPFLATFLAVFFGAAFLATVFLATFLGATFFECAAAFAIEMD